MDSSNLLRKDVFLLVLNEECVCVCVYGFVCQQLEGERCL